MTHRSKTTIHGRATTSSDARPHSHESFVLPRVQSGSGGFIGSWGAETVLSTPIRYRSLLRRTGQRIFTAPLGAVKRWTRGGVRRRDSRLDLLTHMTQLPPRLCLQQRAIPMIRTPTSWSDKTLMWLLVCLVAIATLDDFGSIAMASPSSELFIVADDDDPDDSAERPPICAAGGVGHTDIRWFARSATEITGPAERRNGLVLRYGPRGPPADGSDQHGCKRSLLPLVPPSSIHPSSPVSVAGTPHHTSFEVQTLTSHAMMRAQTAVHDGFFGTCLNRTLAATPYHGLWRRRRRGRQ